MSLHTDTDFELEDSGFIPELSKEEKIEKIAHKRQVKKMLEERLERKRLKSEIDELDGDFDWDDLYR